MVDLTCEEVNDTAQCFVACFGLRSMPRRVGQYPQIEYRDEQNNRKILLAGFVFCFVSLESKIKMSAWVFTLRPIRDKVQPNE